MCSRWLAVDDDDGRIDRTLPLASPEESVYFQNVFFDSLRSNVGERYYTCL